LKTNHNKTNIMKTITQHEMNNILDNLTEPIQDSLKEQKRDILSPSAQMYDPQSETGARHWYYLNHMRIEHKTVAQTAPGADFIIGGRVKK
jgi:hypothetical protein